MEHRTYLPEDQCIVEPVSDLSRCPPVVQLGIDSFLEQSTLETTSSQLCLDSSVDSGLVSIQLVKRKAASRTCSRLEVHQP